MKDIYIDDVAEETGNLFSIWAEAGLDMDKMITNYMLSELRNKIDKRYAYFCTQMYYTQDEQFSRIGTGDYDEILCEWIGQFYTYLQSKLGVSSAALIKKLPFLKLYAMSGVLHDLDMDLAINRVYKNIK